MAIDHASRIAIAEILADEPKESVVAFLSAALRFYKRLGSTVRRIMTDNGMNYVSSMFREACAELGLRHIRTRPYTPRTNGKAERFIQTALREWAYAASSNKEPASCPAGSMRTTSTGITRCCRTSHPSAEWGGQ